MNAGCYGTETRDRMVELRGVTRSGEIVTLTNAEMGYHYRKSNGPRGVVFTSAVYQGYAGRSRRHQGADEGDHRDARRLAADQGADRRVDLQEPRRAFELEADRCRRLPGADGRRCAGFAKNTAIS